LLRATVIEATVESQADRVNKP